MPSFLLRLRASLLIISTLSVIAVFGISQDLCVDVWAHALHGRVIAEKERLPEFGDYSCVQGQNAPRNRDALPSLLFYALLALFGYRGLLFYKLLVIGLTALFLSLQMRAREIPLTIRAMGITCFVLVAESRFLPRADTLNMMFLAAFLFLLTRYRCSKDRWIWCLLPLQLLWAQFHDLACLGIFVTLLYALEGVPLRLQRKWQKKETIRAWTPCNIKILKIASLCLLLSFVNEATYQRALTPLLVMRDIFTGASAYSNIMEFRPVFSNFGLTMRYLALLVISTFLMLRDFRKLNFVDAVLVLVFSIIGAAFLRFAGIYAVVVVPVAASYLWQWAKDRTKRVQLSREVAWGFALSVNLLLVFLVVRGTYHRMENRQIECIPRISPVFYPVRAVEFIEENEIYGNIYANYNIGGFVGYHLYPKGKIFIHSLSLWYSKEHYLLNRDMRQGKISPLSIASVYHIDAFVLIHGFPPLNVDKRIIVALHRSKQWVPVYIDETAIIYLKKDSAASKGLTLHLESLSPDDTEVLSPHGDIWLGDLLNMLGHYSRANEFYKKAAEKGKVPPGLPIRLARFALKDGDCEQALSYLEKSARYLPDEKGWQDIDKLLQIIPSDKKQSQSYRNIIKLRSQRQARKNCHSGSR